MFDAKNTIAQLIGDIRNYFDTYCPGGSAVLGISGGKDSTVTAALLVRALGADRVIGIMMPNGSQPDIDDSHRVFKALGMKEYTMNIQEAYYATLKQLEANGLKVSNDAKVNTQPRLRMVDLYAIPPCLPNRGLVINTCNRSEDYIGYSTKYGDCAGDLSVLGNYFVSQILAIGDALPELPRDLVHKAPSDGLWGDTDEDRIGFTYDELEQYIKTGTCGDEAKDSKIHRMHVTSRHKYEAMPMCGNPTND